MTRTMIMAAAALALTAGSMTMVSARADEVTTQTTTVTTSPAFGYDDGYWDRGHVWHAWANQDAQVTFQKEHGTYFHNWKHDRNPDKGWSDHDVYWKH